MLRARDRGDEYGEPDGDIGDSSASRMIRIERTTLSWITALHNILSSRKAVGVYSRWNSAIFLQHTTLRRPQTRKTHVAGW